MTLKRRRGRPKQDRPTIDYGTVELQRKKNLGLTTEPLDLYLDKDLIDNQQHQAGLRLRWLYTLHFGLPNVTAYNPEYHGSSCIKVENTLWMADRKAEYHQCVDMLKKIGAMRLIFNVCIFSQKLPTQKDINTKHLGYHRTFIEGLDALVTLFTKR